MRIVLARGAQVVRLGPVPAGAGQRLQPKPGVRRDGLGQAPGLAAMAWCCATRAGEKQSLSYPRVLGWMAEAP